MKSDFLTRLHPRETSGLFGSIVRYTSYVRFSKFTLLGVAFLLLLSIVITPLWRAEGEGMRLVFTTMEKMDPKEPEMLNPKFQGVDENNQPFTITADRATQIDSNTVRLLRINADLAAEQGTRWLNVIANEALYHLDRKTITLTGNVQLFEDQGYELHTQEVLVDINAKTATSTTTFSGQGPAGMINAQGFYIANAGAVMQFSGPVTVTLYPQ